MQLSKTMAYARAEEMMFGTCLYPVTTRRGMCLGGGEVIPEIVVHPRAGSEKSLKTLLREFERGYNDALERCVSIGHPHVCLEIEHVAQMTQKTEWGEDVAAQTVSLMDRYEERYGIVSGCRFTIADLRKPDMVHMRDSDRSQRVLEAIAACARHADMVAIESIGGKEIFDHAIIRNDVTGLLFAQAVLGGRDMQWLWPQIVAIAERHNCLPSGDTSCAHANTAMFMAGGYHGREIPHTLAAISRAISVSNTLVAYECGATGPGKNCAYENPIIKAITGVPVSCEGKSSACAHSDFCGNAIAAVCDLWSNEAVEYHSMFGGTTAAVFTEMLGYDTALMNTAINLGYEKELQACMVNSDRYRDPQSYILCPDIAWEIGKVVVEHHQSLYSRARAAALKCGELIFGDDKLQLTTYEHDALRHYMADLEKLPADEGNFIDLCLERYARIHGFRRESYGL
ncbi:methyltransferase MtaB domain-containing protein [Desulfogranum japonicum]|uniref:methyltransferase MtaB domain-containing protein n=1 Tax=Desulfogranum japonicum TaxID=231447 RepID=UPI000416D818|nr:methyltransferase MtaB domain-containing protein [Desulfogranum japonicum]